MFDIQMLPFSGCTELLNQFERFLSNQQRITPLAHLVVEIVEETALKVDPKT